MDRRQLIVGTLLAPLLKPLAAVLPAKAAPVVGGAFRYRSWQIGTAQIMEAARRVNAKVEDELIFGCPPRHASFNCAGEARLKPWPEEADEDAHS